jgi:hypothetical protein
MVSMLKCQILMFMLLMSAASIAEETLRLRPGMTGVADLGAISCETFTAMYPNGPTGMRQSVLYYAEGYIYAKSGKTMDELLAEQADAPGWTFDSLTDVVVNHCAANPGVPVSEAVAVLWEELSS